MAATRMVRYLGSPAPYPANRGSTPAIGRRGHALGAGRRLGLAGTPYRVALCSAFRLRS